MTNTERSTYSPHSTAYGKAPVADAPKDDLASKGAAVFRDAKANVGDMISDAGDYAGKKGREAMDNMRRVPETQSITGEVSWVVA
jgi:hypothetical protein